jgi:hypothetical protein
MDGPKTILGIGRLDAAKVVQKADRQAIECLIPHKKIGRRVGEGTMIGVTLNRIHAADLNRQLFTRRFKDRINLSRSQRGSSQMISDFFIGIFLVFQTFSY